MTCIVFRSRVKPFQLPFIRENALEVVMFSTIPPQEAILVPEGELSF